MLVLRLLIALSLCFGAAVAHAECRLGDVDALPERALVYFPAASTAEPMPLVILLHGSTGTGAEMLRERVLSV
jgi:polyhydroxybutyrate depolymerase